jgi:hypothetical protein
VSEARHRRAARSIEVLPVIAIVEIAAFASHGNRVRIAWIAMENTITHGGILDGQ